jgi:hypothetical protein
MPDKSPKGLALLLLAKKHPDMKPSEDTAMNPANEEDNMDEGADAPDQDLVDGAHDVLMAIAMKNEEQLASALKDFVDMCGDASGSEAPESPESDEEMPNEVEGG